MHVVLWHDICNVFFDSEKTACILVTIVRSLTQLKSVSLVLRDSYVSFKCVCSSRRPNTKSRLKYIETNEKALLIDKISG